MVNLRPRDNLAHFLFIVTTKNIMTSQSASEYSTMMYTPTERLTSAHISLMKTLPTSVHAVSVGTATSKSILHNVFDTLSSPAYSGSNIN